VVVSPEAGVREVARLRACLDDLVGLVALPTLWAGREPSHIASSLLDALLEMLPLDFALLRLNDHEGGPLRDELRAAARFEETARAHDVGQALALCLGDDALKWPPGARVTIGGVELSVAVSRLGIQGDTGVLVAGCRDGGFPGQAEKLRLDVAASQAAIAIERSRRLRDSERNSRLLVDSIPGLVALLTTDGEVAFVNRQILEYTARPLEQLKQWGTNDIVHPEDLPKVIEAFTRSITSGTPYEILQRLRRGDGAYLWFRNNGFPLRDARGHIVRWCVLLTDVDERRRAERALRDERKRAEESLAASERNLKLIIDTIPALAWSAPSDGSADFFNQHYLDFIGLSAEQARGWGWTAAVHPEDLESLTAAWQRIMASEAAGEAEARLRRQDGSYRWLLFRANPLRDESGRILRWYGVNTDIEDRRQAEAELRRAHDSFAVAQRLSRTGSFVVDLLVEDHNWSEESYRIFELPPGTTVTVQTVRDLIVSEDLPLYDSMIQRGATGEDVDFVFRIVTARGTPKHVRAIAHVVEQVAGRPLFVGALQDMTDIKAAEEALTRARADLAHIARVTTLSALAASIAHEVNQPLSGIITNAGTCLRLLAQEPADLDGARETARRTIRDGNRASDVVARLRALFSRKDATLELVNLNETTREVLALSASELARGGVVTRLELTEQLPAVTGDRVQLQQVILNLLLNAKEAMSVIDDRPRQLVIRTGLEGSARVRLSVEDAGVGLAAAEVQRLFEAFYTTKSGGMGIGLSVSQFIIERHRGRLWAEPNDGPGATFSFSIPCDGGQ
jgi:PAS domain S-box-containing protein